MAATPSDCVEIIAEESPRAEGAASTTPYRLSSDVLFLPATALKIDPAVTMMDRSDELRGIEGGVPQLVDAYNPVGSLSVRGYLNALTWLLHVAGMTGAHTVGDGIITDPDSGTIPAGAHRWVFTKRSGVAAKSLQIQACYVSDGTFLKGQGFGVSQLTFDTGGAIAATLMGLVVGRIADPQLVPAYDLSSILPIRRGDLTLTWLTGGATIDEGFGFTLDNPLIQRHTAQLTTPSFFPDKLEAGDEKVRMSGTVPKTSLDPEDYDAFLAGTTFNAKAKWLVPVHIGATTYHYTMWLEMPKCQIIGGDGPSELTNARRHPSSYAYWAAWDESAGYDFKITLVNAVAAIETFA